ncbi:MAG: hypothetical protein WCB51_12550 [Candidatus Dormiibacterota bacterium]
MANILTDPPFAADPPIKLNVPAKTLGLVIGILAIIGIVIDLIALPVVFALNNVASDATTVCRELGGTNCGGSSGIFGLALIGVLISLVGAVLYAFGGFRMYQLNRSGKDLVIYGLAVNLIGGILDIVGYGGVGSFIFSLIIAVVVYYLVVISRWPGDAPLVATAPPGGYGSPPPPPPSA